MKSSSIAALWLSWVPLAACISASGPPLVVATECPQLPPPPASIMIPRAPNFQQRLLDFLSNSSSRLTKPSGNCSRVRTSCGPIGKSRRAGASGFDILHLFKRERMSTYWLQWLRPMINLLVSCNATKNGMRPLKFKGDFVAVIMGNVDCINGWIFIAVKLFKPQMSGWWCFL